MTAPTWDRPLEDDGDGGSEDTRQFNKAGNVIDPDTGEEIVLPRKREYIPETMPEGPLTHVVDRPFTAYSEVRLRGELLPAEQWRTVRSLESGRYLTPISVPIADLDPCDCGRHWSSERIEVCPVCEASIT